MSKSSRKNKKTSLKEKRKEDSKGKKKKNNFNIPQTSLSPHQEEVNKLIGFYQTGQLSQAEKLAVLITQRFPEHQLSWKILGALLRQTGRFAESVKANRRSAQLNPRDPEAQFNLGNSLKMLGELEAAAECFRQALTLKQNYIQAYNNLGNTLREQGKTVEAEKNFLIAISLDPAYADGHYNLGFLYQKREKLDEAEREYRKAIALRGDFPEAHNNLGNVLIEQNRLEEAKESLSHAIALRSDFREALMSRWQILFDQGKFEDALRDADLCDTSQSRACSLETLYVLGRNEEIYRRLSKWAELDDQNIRMAAFASFISSLNRKETAHNFCSNPLEFLYFSNVSFHIENFQVFLRKLIEDLSAIDTVWQPPKKSTVNGSQTKNDINLFETQSKSIKLLESVILEELNNYHHKYNDRTCSFISKWPSEKLLRGWHVILKQNGYQESHIHVDGWLSGVVYLQVVPPKSNGEGAIEFSLNGVNYPEPATSGLRHQPNLGDIVFFPSSLHHRTIPFTTEADRIIVSFDLVPQSQINSLQ